MSKVQTKFANNDNESSLITNKHFTESERIKHEPLTANPFHNNTYSHERFLNLIQELSDHNANLQSFIYLCLMTPSEAQITVHGDEPLQNPTLDVLVAEGGNALRQQTGLWSTEAKV
jgi:hypothetical protein